MNARGRLWVLCLVVLGVVACASTPTPPYQHSRYDYWAFRARVGMLPEPNYLPWATHREVLPGGQAALVVCRWPDRAFPLRYHVVPPSIPMEEQDEFNPRDPQEYVVAVRRAFERWGEAIGRPVRFLHVDDPDEATLRVHLDVTMHQEREGQVLGMVRDEAHRCRVLGSGPDLDHVRIEFSVHEAYLYITDSFGLLTPGQVHAIALHEIGHILGASGQHSPLRGDVMYKIADDRRVEKLSEHDRNTLRALYRAPPGAVYVRLGEPHGEPVTEIRRRPPSLDREIVDERFGFEARFPKGWQVIRSSRGWVAVDGLSWDYDASLQVIALRGNVVAYMQHSAMLQRAPDETVSREFLELDGEPLGRIVVRSEEWTEETAVLAWRKGWILLIVADCRSADYSLYQPWFQRVLLSLDHPRERESDAGVGAGTESPER
jgi:hypothetical protein